MAQSPVATLVSVLAPLALVGATLGWAGRPEAAPGPSPDLLQCQKGLAATGADVAVFGNSKSRTDIDVAALGKGLGTNKIAVLGVDGTSAPVWYAAMANCLYGSDAHPKLVLVYGTPAAITRVQPESDVERARLDAYAPADDAVLRQKVFGGADANPFWERVRARRTAIDAAFHASTRDLVAGLFFAPKGPDPLLARGEAFAEPALDRVLGATADATARRRAIPIAEATQGASVASAPVDYDHTLVPDFVALAAKNGAKIVFVNAPVASSKASYAAAPGALARGLVEGLNAAGAGYVDLSGMGLPDSAFGDGIHMNASGKPKATAALVERLVAMGAMGAGPIAQAELPRRPPTATRTGTPPSWPPLAPVRGPWDCGWEARVPTLAALSDTALSAAGRGLLSPLVVLEDGKPLTGHAPRADFDLACKGAFNHQGGVVKFSPSGGPADVVPSRVYTLGLDDALPVRDVLGNSGWWVYPGTTLRLDLPDGWDAPVDGFRVAVAATPVAGGAGTPTVEVAGVNASFTGTGALSAVLTPSTPSGAWSVAITSPSDGPFLLVDRVVAGGPANPWYALGTPDPGRAVDLVAGKVSFGVPPAPLPGATLGAAVADSGKMWHIDAPQLGVPGYDAIRAVAGMADCAPLRVAEDGKPLAFPNTPARDVVDQGGGRYHHVGTKVYFSTADGSPPAGHAYTASLDAERTCRKFRWIYPGDENTFSLAPDQLGPLTKGATRFELSANAVPSAAGPMHLVLRVGDRVVLDTEVATETLNSSPPAWDLPAPVGRDAGPVSLTLSTPSTAPYVLVTRAALVEPGGSPFSPLPGPPPEDGGRE